MRMLSSRNGTDWTQELQETLFRGETPWPGASGSSLHEHEEIMTVDTLGTARLYCLLPFPTLMSLTDSDGLNPGTIQTMPNPKVPQVPVS